MICLRRKEKREKRKEEREKRKERERREREKIEGEGKERKRKEGTCYTCLKLPVQHVRSFQTSIVAPKTGQMPCTALVPSDHDSSVPISGRNLNMHVIQAGPLVGLIRK